MRILLVAALMSASFPVCAQEALPPLPDAAVVREALGSGSEEVPAIAGLTETQAAAAALPADSDYECVVLPGSAADRARQACAAGEVGCERTDAPIPAGCMGPIRASLKRLETEPLPKFRAFGASSNSGPSRGEKVLYGTSIAFGAAGMFADAHTTVTAIDRGAVEANVAKVMGERNKAGVVLFGSTLQAGVMVATHYLIYKKGHPRAAAVVNFLAGGLHFGAAFHNNRVCRPSCR